MRKNEEQIAGHTNGVSGQASVMMPWYIITTKGIVPEDIPERHPYTEFPAFKEYYY